MYPTFREKRFGAHQRDPYPELIPTTIPGCMLWLDASRVPGVDGDALAEWKDLSPSNNSPTQGTAANKPIVRENVFNGRKALAFDMQGPCYMTFPNNIDLANDCTMIVVANNNGLGNNGYACLLQTKQTSFYSQMFAAAQYISYWGIFRTSGLMGGLMQSNSPLVMSFWYTAANDFWVWTGTARRKVTTTFNANASATSRIGWDGSGTQHHNGCICEVIIFNNKILQDSLYRLIVSLEQKWRRA